MEAECSSKAQRLSLNTIDALPQTIVESILSLLPIEEAARTSILSRDWRYKWTKIPKLVFRYPTWYKISAVPDPDSMASARKNMDDRCKVFYTILQILILRQGPIHEFTLVMEADCECSELDQIILHLSRNHTVKNLKLDTGYVHDFEYLYRLPFSAFSLHQLTDLDLSYIDLNNLPTTFGGFVNLRSLCLQYVIISTKALLHLLSNSPSLKSFTLLTEAGNIGSGNCTFIELFKCLPVIEHLTTSDHILPWLVLGSVREERPSLVHLKYLCLVDLCFADAEELSTLLAVLIKCSPNLEKMKLVMGARNLFYDANEECVKEMYSDVWLENLKEVEIEGFGNLKPEMEFVKIILVRSPKLKKLTIRPSYPLKEEVKMLKVLLRAPRASQVDIIVK